MVKNYSDKEVCHHGQLDEELTLNQMRKYVGNQMRNRGHQMRKYVGNQMRNQPLSGQSDEEVCGQSDEELYITRYYVHEDEDRIS